MHHLLRRRAGLDVPELCVSLCRTCHAKHHSGIQPNTETITKLLVRVYGYDYSAYNEWLGLIAF